MPLYRLLLKGASQKVSYPADLAAFVRNFKVLPFEHYSTVGGTSMLAVAQAYYCGMATRALADP